VEEGMSPIEAAIKRSNEIFAVISISITWRRYILTCYLPRRLCGTSVSGICVVIGAAVLISAFVSLTLTPMLNAYLMKGGEQKKSKFCIDRTLFPEIK
jgi:HAE1 family hydrophobic/amphiphilic exporter-1/multidrug efflux pump